MSYRLYTHCGIREVRIGRRYYKAVPPLDDGSGNPPPGWGDPYQDGTMTEVSPTEVVFADALGHHVAFQLRPHASRFEKLCA